jgi:hypothetical protein
VIHINYLDIPMPNELESSSLQPISRKISDSLSSLIRFIKENVTVEEVLLISIIILLLFDSRDNEILIILLIYILLF